LVNLSILLWRRLVTTPPLVRGTGPPLQVWHELAYSALVGGIQHHFSIVLTLHTGRLLPPEVALAYSRMHYFAGAGNAEAARGSFICL
jgi:hypothetical protein